MRFSYLATLAAVFVSLTGHVAYAAHENFGSHTCSQPVICPQDMDTWTSDQWATAGNVCLGSAFGYPAPTGGFFDTSMGLDANECLTALPGVIHKGMGAQLAPACCAIKLPNNSCVMHCDLIAQ